MAIKLIHVPTNDAVSNYTIRISYLSTSGRFRRSSYIAPPVVICHPLLPQGIESLIYNKDLQVVPWSTVERLT